MPHSYTGTLELRAPGALPLRVDLSLTLAVLDPPPSVGVLHRLSGR